jgi:hypothetical protein
MLMNGTLNRAWRIGVLLSLAWHQLHAQKEINPMTTVRISTAGARIDGRLVGADSQSLTIETPKGSTRRIARTDITSVELRDSQTRKAATIFGITAAGAGALLGMVMVAALCETADGCDDDYPAAVVLGGGFFGGAGAVAGAIIGHEAGGWRLADKALRLRDLGPARRCFVHPRFEGGLSRPNFSGRLSDGHFNVAAVCSTSLAFGVETGALTGSLMESREEFVDPVFGIIVGNSTRAVARSVRGAFVERSWAAGPARVALLASLGSYETRINTGRIWNLTDYSGNDWRSFYDAHPLEASQATSHALGAGLGIKTTIATGPRFSLGLVSRLHEVGSAHQQMETGVTMSYRP